MNLKYFIALFLANIIIISNVPAEQLFTSIEGDLASYDEEGNDGLEDDNILFSGTGGSLDVAEDSVVASGTSSDNISWTLDNAGTLTISGSGEIGDYTSEYYTAYYISTAPWGTLSRKTKKIQIDNGITRIGNYAFAWFDQVTSIELPSSIESIGDYAFRMCNSLEVMTVPTGVKA